MQTTAPAPSRATPIALPLTFAELLDLNEPARAVAGCTPWSARMLYGLEAPWTEILPCVDEAGRIVGPAAGGDL
jgi:hypothetical protein